MLLIRVDEGCFFRRSSLLCFLVISSLAAQTQKVPGDQEARASPPQSKVDTSSPSAKQTGTNPQTPKPSTRTTTSESLLPPIVHDFTSLLESPSKNASMRRAPVSSACFGQTPAETRSRCFRRGCWPSWGAEPFGIAIVTCVSLRGSAAGRKPGRDHTSIRSCRSMKTHRSVPARGRDRRMALSP